jgi:hypothetical protein
LLVLADATCRYALVARDRLGRTNGSGRCRFLTRHRPVVLPRPDCRHMPESSPPKTTENDRGEVNALARFSGCCWKNIHSRSFAEKFLADLTPTSKSGSWPGQGVAAISRPVVFVQRARRYFLPTSSAWRNFFRAVITFSSKGASAIGSSCRPSVPITACPCFFFNSIKTPFRAASLPSARK